MKLHYYPETDSLYIEPKARPGAKTQEVTNGLLVDLDEQGEVVGFRYRFCLQAIRPLKARNRRLAAARHHHGGLIHTIERFFSLLPWNGDE
jgi:uncharacterized protein YuzE